MYAGCRKSGKQIEMENQRRKRERLRWRVEKIKWNFICNVQDGLVLMSIDWHRHRSSLYSIQYNTGAKSFSFASKCPRLHVVYSGCCFIKRRKIQNEPNSFSPIQRNIRQSTWLSHIRNSLEVSKLFAPVHIGTQRMSEQNQRNVTAEKPR